MTELRPAPEELERMAKEAKINEQRARENLPPIVFGEVPSGLLQRSKLPRFIRRLFGIQPKTQPRKPMY